jgi:general nucleoside transport system ATP-binding protein
MKLELRGITKRFGSLIANNDVNLTIEPGEIHCLLGENGAGKTTLMNVLFGMISLNEGQILIDDEAVTIREPKDAVAHRIGMVHQHFMLVPVFTVAENVVLGFEPVRPWPILDHRSANRELREVSQRYGLDVDPEAVVENLPIGMQQRAEILKALDRDADVLILDEPTAVLTPQETESLFAIMRGLRAQGKSIVFITHKLKEVLAVADRITVMRLGEVVGTTTPADTDEDALAAMMVGRTVILEVEKGPGSPGDPACIVGGLYAEDDRGLTAVKDVSFDIRSGEILAIAGVQGNGQTELVEALTGLRAPTHGSVRIGDLDVTRKSVSEILNAGVGHIPEDRLLHGLIQSMTIEDNLVLDRRHDPQFSRWGTRNLKAIREHGAQLLEEFDIRAANSQVLAGTLSGGNQQKVIVARELSRQLSLLICSQPTRGLDVGSIEYVHRKIVAIRDAGVAVLLVSSELDEVIALGDRIAVMYEGAIVGIVPPTTSRDQLGLMMAGSTGEVRDGAAVPA